MKLLTLSVGTGLACAASSGGGTGAAVVVGGDGRLVPDVVPTGYRVALSIDPASEKFSGRVEIGVRLAAPTRTVTLHGRALEIRRAAARVGRETVTANSSNSLAPGETTEPSLLTLTFNRTLPAGTTTIEIDYAAAFNPKLAGLYRAKDADRWYAFTQFEPNDARRAFPCFDEPGVKVPFEVELTVPQGLLAFSNAPEASRANRADGTTTFVFAKTKPLPTYLVAFAVGDLEVREGVRTPVPIRLIAAKGKTHLGTLALDAAAALIERLADYFGAPYPYEKLDIVAVPDFPAGAMENAGFVTFREQYLLLDPKQAGESAVRELASIIAHEFAHQWFGNWVTMKWWDDLWLNEAFATWITSKVVDAWKPAYRLAMEDVQSKGHAMTQDALAAARKIRQPVRTAADAEEAFDAITYEKGSALLSMLEAWVGPAAFQNGIRDYLAKNAWGNATASDFLSALSRAAARDVRPVASSFLDQSGVPLVTIEPKCVGGRVSLKISQERYLAGGAGKARGKAGGEARWSVPVCVRFDHAGVLDEPICAVVSDRVVDIKTPVLRCPTAVIPNVGEKGYYRYAMPRDWMARLTETALTPTERLGVVMNASALLRMGAISAELFFEQLVAFGSDTDRFVVKAVADGLRLASAALVDDAGRPGFRALVRRALAGNAKRVGWSQQRGDDADTKLLRRELFSALGGMADDRVVLDEAERLTKSYLRDRTSIDADFAEIAAHLASRRADGARLEKWVSVLGLARNPQETQVALAGLAGFTEPKLARKALDLTLTETIRKQDAIRIPRRMLGTHLTRDLAYDWFKANFDLLKARVPESYLGYIYLTLGQFRTKERRDDAAKFFGAPSRQIEGGTRRLSEGLELLDIAIALYERERDGARRYLANEAARPVKVRASKQ